MKMDRVIELFADPAFWFSAIILNLIVNLVASYARNWLDIVLARYSDRLKKRQVRKQKHFRIAVDHLVSFPEVVPSYRDEVIMAFVRTIVTGMAGIGLGFLGLLISLLAQYANWLPESSTQYETFQLFLQSIQIQIVALIILSGVLGLISTVLAFSGYRHMARNLGLLAAYYEEIYPKSSEGDGPPEAESIR